MKKDVCTAIVLAAGRGTRMGAPVAKQYLEIQGKPVVVRALEAFAASPRISRIVLMAGADQLDYCREEIVERYRIPRVCLIEAGGRERYETVWKALAALRAMEESLEEKTDYVFIHDGARPFVTGEIIERAYQDVRVHRASVVGMPVKDTIKLTDGAGMIADTPRRELVWQAQTPQVFAFPLIIEAFERLMAAGDGKLSVTDDAMVVREGAGVDAHMVRGSYENIKITTPEDLKIAESLLAFRESGQNV